MRILLSRLRSKITYANVVASLAMFLALGGVSYAVTQLPKNSVGSKQIKSNAVASDEVKNGSLKAGDFAKGVLPGAPVNGANGAKGDKGDKGEPADLGFLDNSHDLPGLGIATISIEGNPLEDFKAYRIDCSTAKLCTLTIGGLRSRNIEYAAWFELAVLGSASATKDFSLTQYTIDEGEPVARYHVTKGRPLEMHTLNDRYELTFSAEFIQRVAI